MVHELANLDFAVSSEKLDPSSYLLHAVKISAIRKKDARRKVVDFFIVHF